MTETTRQSSKKVDWVTASIVGVLCGAVTILFMIKADDSEYSRDMRTQDTRQMELFRRMDKAEERIEQSESRITRMEDAAFAEFFEQEHAAPKFDSEAGDK